MLIYEHLIAEHFENNLICKRDIVENIKLKPKKHHLDKIDMTNLTIIQLLYIANCWNTYKSGYLYKLYQISNYTWLSPENLNKCIDRMAKLNITSDSIFEKSITIVDTKEILNRKLKGYIDCYDNNIIYELKCVTKLTKEHYLELAFYMYMFEMTQKTRIPTTYILFNILTNEYNFVECDVDNLKEIVKIIIYHKYTTKKVLTNDEFLENNKNIASLYF